MTLESVLGENIHEGYHVRIFVHNGLNVNLEIFEIALSENSAYNGVIELVLDKNSSANLTYIVVPNKRTPSFSNLRIVLNENSSLTTRTLMHRQQVNGLLLDRKSSLKIDAALLGKSERKIDFVFDTSIRGLDNNLLFNGLALAEDKSYVNMRAIGRISRASEDAIVDIQAYAYNIGPESKAIGSPVLEINSNKVKLARHSVSISNISEEVLFYLMSRGLSLEDCKKLFRAELVDKVITKSNEFVRKDVKEIFDFLSKADHTSIL